MNPFPSEKFAAAQKANFDTLCGLTDKAFEGFQQWVQLNLHVMKSTLAESQSNAQKALSVKDPQELLTLQAGLTQPLTEQALSYGRQVQGIVSSLQAEFAKIAEVHYEEHTRRVQTLVDNVAKNAPSGSEAAVGAMKSAVMATNTLYETARQATQQASAVAESNFNAVAAAASKATHLAVEKAARSAKK
jgi:phasin family protein